MYTRYFAKNCLPVFYQKKMKKKPGWDGNSILIYTQIKGQILKMPRYDRKSDFFSNLASFPKIDKYWTWSVESLVLGCVSASVRD